MDEQIAKIITKHYPEIANGWHVPIWGIVNSINETPPDGCLSDNFRPYYCVSVNILSKDGQPTSIPTMENIAIAGNFSESGGIMQLPEPGMIVSIQFAFGMPDKPYVDRVLPYSVSMPGLERGEIVIQSRHGSKQLFAQDGSINLETDSAYNEYSREKNVKTGNETLNRHSASSKTSCNSIHDVGGIYQLAAFGAMYLLTTGNSELSALKNLSLTAGEDLKEDIYGERISEIKKKLSVCINKKGTLNIDESSFNLTFDDSSMNLDSNLNITVDNGSIKIGNLTVDIVTTLYSLIEIVSQLANTLSSHTHPTPKGPSGPPVESGMIASASLQSISQNTLLEAIKP